MKRKGFTLIELVVVIALIAILAVTLAPRLRDQIAKGNDAKAIALLGSLRTASEIHFADNNKTVATATDTLTATILTDLEKGLDSTAIEMLNDAETRAATVKIGGRKADENDTVTYGGEIGYTFVSPNASVTADGISMWFATNATDLNAATNGEAFDTKGKAWASY